MTAPMVAPMIAPIIAMGWDVGGANLKAVRVDGGRVSCGVWETPLWRNSDLAPFIAAALRQLGGANRHLVAFSGESADCFTDRRQGVRQLMRQMQNLSGEVRFYGFAGASEDASEPLLLAAGNWYAAAKALSIGDGGGSLWVDIGSTTTDIVSLTTSPAPADDFTRLRSRSLVYRGIVRTPIMAVAREITMAEGETLPLVAEHFADMGDVYSLLGFSLDGITADGRPRDAASCARRLLRMVGRDYRPSLRRFCLALAEALRERFEGQITAHLPPTRRVIGSGIGSFIVRKWAAGRAEYVDAAKILFPYLDEAQAAEVSKHAPAAALAWLATR